MSDLRQETIDTPAGLNELYEMIITKMIPSDKTFALAAFRWMTFARRPLKLGEMRYAVALSALQTKNVSLLNIRNSTLWCKDDKLISKRIRRVSQGLALILTANHHPDFAAGLMKGKEIHIVVFDHFTVAKFYERTRNQYVGAQLCHQNLA